MIHYNMIPHSDFSTLHSCEPSLHFHLMRTKYDLPSIKDTKNIVVLIRYINKWKQHCISNVFHHSHENNWNFKVTNYLHWGKPISTDVSVLQEINESYASLYLYFYSTYNCFPFYNLYVFIKRRHRIASSQIIICYTI